MSPVWELGQEAGEKRLLPLKPRQVCYPAPRRAGPWQCVCGGVILLGLLPSRFLNLVLRENLTAALNNLTIQNRDDKSIILIMFPKALETFFIGYGFSFMLIN